MKMTKKQYDVPIEDYKDVAEETISKAKSFDEQSATQLQAIIGRFLKAYEAADLDEESTWLEAPLQEELPEKTAEDIRHIRQTIQQSVAAWDENMVSLHEACAEGKTKEEWLEGKLQEATVGVNIEDYGNYLAQTTTELHQENRDAIEEINGEKESAVAPFHADGHTWDETSTHEFAIQLGREAEVSTLASTVLQTGWKLAETLPLGEKFQDLKKVGNALRTGEDWEVKEAASAALKAGIEKGIIPILPADTPTEVLTGLACTGVEQAKILLKFADGDISGGQALNLMGRVATANAANVCTYWGQRIGSKVGTNIGTMVGALLPVLAPAGAVIGSFVGGVVGRVGGSMIGKAIQNATRKIAEIAKPVLHRAWEGIKSVGRSIANGVKKLLSIFE